MLQDLPSLVSNLAPSGMHVTHFAEAALVSLKYNYSKSHLRASEFDFPSTWKMSHYFHHIPLSSLSFMTFNDFFLWFQSLIIILEAYPQHSESLTTADVSCKLTSAWILYIFILKYSKYMRWHINQISWIIFHVPVYQISML